MEIERYDTTNLYTVKSLAKGASLAEVVIPKDGLHAMLLLIPPPIDHGGGAISIVQTTHKVVVGGSTFILKQAIQ